MVYIPFLFNYLVFCSSFVLKIVLFLSNNELCYALQGLINNLISLGLGREAAFAAAVLGDNALMEKAWQDTGMLAEAVLHAHV